MAFASPQPGEVAPKARVRGAILTRARNPSVGLQLAMQSDLSQWER